MITLKIDCQVHLAPLPEIPGAILREIKGRLSFPNPAYLEAKKRGFSTWNIRPEVRDYRVEHSRLIIPGRGFGRQLLEILKQAGMR